MTVEISALWKMFMQLTKKWPEMIVKWPFMNSKFWATSSKLLNILEVLAIVLTFYVVNWPKYGQIYDVHSLSFHLTPSLHTFMKIDVTSENGTQKPKNISVGCEWSRVTSLSLLSSIKPATLPTGRKLAKIARAWLYSFS